jgi:phage gp46-like protein
MADIATIWDAANSRGDWQVSIATGDLVADQDLSTAVLISLFTDAQAGDDDIIPDGSGDPRGWWGGPIGSKLWLLERSKQLATVPVLAKSYISDALAWMISDGVAVSIAVTTEWTRAGLLGAAVMIDRGRGATFVMDLTRLSNAPTPTPSPDRKSRTTSLGTLRVVSTGSTRTTT